jgi:hypothetical protein
MGTGACSGIHQGTAAIMVPVAVAETADVLSVPAGAQGMKGGAAAAEVAFTAAQLAAGTAPQLHTAFVSALARCGELSQVRRPSSCLLVLVIRTQMVVLP